MRIPAIAVILFYVHEKTGSDVVSMFYTIEKIPADGQDDGPVVHAGDNLSQRLVEAAAGELEATDFVNYQRF